MKKAAFGLFMVLIVIPAFIVLYAFTVMWLWNWLMPDIANLPEITFWQSAGLIFLAKLLFGFGGNCGGGNGWWSKKKQKKHNKKWKKLLEEKYGDCKPKEEKSTDSGTETA